MNNEQFCVSFLILNFYFITMRLDVLLPGVEVLFFKSTSSIICLYFSKEIEVENKYFFTFFKSK